MGSRTAALLLVSFLAAGSAWGATPVPTDADLDRQFTEKVRPFLETYCIKCHSGEKPKAQLDLKPYSSMTLVVNDHDRWVLVLDKLTAKEMPPDEAKDQPTLEARQQMIDWITAAQKSDALKHAGDPGIVLARRLSNAEYDYTIRDLTGVDMHPTREFPVDPSNTGGFDNSGESLVMSPALLNKYLKAARDIANHLYLKQQGFGFATHSMESIVDRDKFCELQIVNFYHQQDTDYANYFQAAWRFKNRAVLGKADAKLTDMAAESKVSAKYLAMVWGLLEETKEDVGPIAKLQSMWKSLPAPADNQPDVARSGCEQMREYVIQLRKKVEPRFTGLAGRGGQALPMWLNTQYATHRTAFDPAQLQVEGEERPAAAEPATQPARGRGRGARGGTIANQAGDPDLVVPAGQRSRYETSFAEFCSVFPDRFYTQQRGTNYFNEGNETGRLLSAGFLNRMGYFRDDIPLYELLLSDEQQKQLDSMWRDMDYIAQTTLRTYLQSFDTNTDIVRTIRGDGNGTPDEIMATEANIQKYVDTLVERGNGNDKVTTAVKDYYKSVNDAIRWAEKAHIDAEPSHLEALLNFAARAYRRPLSSEEREDILSYYKSAREKDHLDHEDAIRDCIVYVLMSPDLTYRIDLVAPEPGIHALSDYDLASRLSYFLWASMPDEELLSHAAARDLHDPKVIAAQARRMLKDPRAKGMALEFGGNWLEFRHFEDIASVDRERFSSFTNDLKEAMFEEPVRFILDIVQNNRSVMDFIYANDTFVNPVLAKHYGMPEMTGGQDDWVQIKDADKYNRGSLLPMAVFLTKNAPGLRTSPVKRGNWVVKTILGERIAPPPVGVPELPRDEAKLELPLAQMLARHREDPNCAACHARFDSLGLIFEGFGPIGEKRDKDMAGHLIDAHATFPDGSEGTGIAGVRQYIKEHRQKDYIDNLCSKLVVYGLGRSLIPPDRVLIDDMSTKLAADEYRFDSLVESIVTSPQFLTKRGREATAER